MRHDARKLLEDARGACAEVEQFVVGHTQDSFVKEIAVQRSVERSLEVIGEALRRLRDLDDDMGDRIPNLSRIIGLRNILAHGYDVLDYEIIWQIATNEVPDLRLSLQQLIVSGR
jgi:uncharacterized protein with HEPN domain